MKIFVDTPYLIAAVRRQDENHARAKELFEPDHELVTSVLVFNEFVTFLQRKDGVPIAYENGAGLLDSDILIEELGVDELPAMLATMKKFTGLSFTDASNIEIMKRLEIKKIVSFDSDFDSVPWIERLH